MLHSYKSYLLLLESKRKDQLKAKYIDKLGMSEDIFKKLYTPNAEWLMKIYTNTPDEKKIQIVDKTSYDDFEDILLVYAEMFNNNKENLSIQQIGKIKNIDEMRVVLDEIRGFEDFETGEKDSEKWILYNDHEWCIFKAYEFEISELAENKKRSSNWCTTYDEGHYKTHLGPEGGLIYICNKIDETEDWALECSTEEIRAWNWEDDQKHSRQSFNDIIDDIWNEDDLPWKVLKDKLTEIEEDMPEIDWEGARERAREEIINWQYSRYNDLEVYSNYVWRHIDDDGFLDDMKDNEYERYRYDWKDEVNLDKFTTLLYDYFSKDGYNIEKVREKIKEYFIEQMKEYNESGMEDLTDEEKEEYEGYDTENVEIGDILQFIDDNYTDNDAPELIEHFGFEDDVVEELVDAYIGNFRDAEDYVENIYGNIHDSGAISYVDGYIKWSELADDIVEDMDEETLRNYM
jgi:hypothetical protein